MSADEQVQVPTLAEMGPRGRAIALAYLEEGLHDGYTRGWHDGRAALLQQLADEWDVHPLSTDDDQRAYANARAKAVDYPTLCERRGEHTRAAKVRAAYVLLGLLPAGGGPS